MFHFYRQALLGIHIIQRYGNRSLNRSLLVGIHQMGIDMETVHILFLSISNIRIQVIEITVNRSVLYHFNPRRSAHYILPAVALHIGRFYQSIPIGRSGKYRTGLFVP